MALACARGRAALLAGCGPSQEAADHGPGAAAGDGFRSADCNGVTDADVTKAVGSSMFTKAVVSDAGCFWQENTVLGSFGQAWASRHGGIAAATWTPNGRWNSRPDAR